MENYERKYKEALRWMQGLYSGLHGATKEEAEHYFPELKEKESEDEKIRKELYIYLDWLDGRKACAPKGNYTIRQMLDWLEKQGKQKQTWEPNAAQLIVIKDLIEDKNTSKVNKVILRSMFDEFKQFTNTNKREIDDAYLQGICDAKHEIEKQGERKSSDKVEPKFKVGDWVVNNVCLPMQIASIKDGMYIFTNGDAMSVLFIDGNFHLWTIQDAEDGDVLIKEETGEPFIHNGNRGSYIPEFLGAYCGISDGRFRPNGSPYYWGRPTCPATKEQCDLLFSKMKEAGYEWDAEKKELKKKLSQRNLMPIRLLSGWISKRV